MDKTTKSGLVSYKEVSPGFEAIYTGKKSSAKDEKVELITTVYANKSGHEIRKWSVVPWSWPGQEKEWDEEIKSINDMQSKLGDLDASTRQIRAHIASIVPCDSGFPVTVDELLNAIGKGKLEEPTFRNGCWCSGMWWEQQTTQPSQMQSIRIIYVVLQGYLAGQSKESLIHEFPDAAGFINRTFEWLGPVSKLADYQKLMMERMFLTIDFFTKASNTQPTSLFSDISRLQEIEAYVKDLFEEGGQGAQLDMDISEKAKLPKIYPQWNPKYSETLKSLKDHHKKEVYKTCCAIASGVYTLSDCHHNTFRFIESWIHGIGTGRLGISTRKTATEHERLGQSLFGYVLGLDKWLVGVPLQFLLLDLGHIDIGFDLKNEILRVYAYLGEEKSPVKEWLAGCLWYNLYYCPIDEGNPAGLVRHKDILDRTEKAGLCLRGWMDSVLGKNAQNAETG